MQVKQDRWERDHRPDKDDYLGTSYFTKYFHNGGTFAFNSTHPLKRTDFGYGDKTEEVYQKVSYRCTRTATGLHGPTGYTAAPQASVGKRPDRSKKARSSGHLSCNK